MASYNVTETVNEILALGGTEALVKATGATYETWCAGWQARNARTYDALTLLFTTLQTADAEATPGAPTNPHVEAAYRAGARHGVDGQVWDNA